MNLLSIYERIFNDVFCKTFSRYFFVFLCGGADKKNIRNKIRSLLEAKELQVLYPEDLFMDMLNRDKKTDLLEYENLLADNSDVVCIICESMGSAVELGAFIQNSKLEQKMIVAVLYGDLIMRLSNFTRAYEKDKQTDALKQKWIEECQKRVLKSSSKLFRQTVDEIIEDFSKIELLDIQKPKVGIVGEILVKYLPQANNNLQDLLEKEGCEVVMPDLTDFVLYCLRNEYHKGNFLSKSKFTGFMCNMGVNLIEHYRKYIRNQLIKSKFTHPLKIQELEDYAQEVVSLGNQYGEGWLLTAEMIELIHINANNIVCIQPFGCLPNHITGKGVIKRIRQLYPQANIIPIDYDPGASEVNQINRIKLMLSQAKEKINN